MSKKPSYVFWLVPPRQSLFRIPNHRSRANSRLHLRSSDLGATFFRPETIHVCLPHHFRHLPLPSPARNSRPARSYNSILVATQPFTSRTFLRQLFLHDSKSLLGGAVSYRCQKHWCRIYFGKMTAKPWLC